MIRVGVVFWDGTPTGGLLEVFFCVVNNGYFGARVAVRVLVVPVTKVYRPYAVRVVTYHVVA